MTQPRLTSYQIKLKEIMVKLIDNMNDDFLQCPEKTMAFIAIFNPAYESDLRGANKTVGMVNIWISRFDRMTSFYSEMLCNAFRGAKKRDINLLFKANRAELLKLSNYSIQGFTQEDVKRIHNTK